MDRIPLSLILGLAPELTEEIGRRALLLSELEGGTPVGRRALCKRLAMTEREVRASADALRENGLIEADAAGMRLTQAGRLLCGDAKTLCRALSGLQEEERRLGERLSLRVIIAPGGTARDVGRAAADRLREMLRPGMIVAVTGGQTMLEMARAALPGSEKGNVAVVPARGGLSGGENTQAGAVASLLAEGLGGRFCPLHLPDELTRDALRELDHIPEVREGRELLRRADIVLHGVGTAEEAAEKRELPLEARLKLRAEGAVGETLGVFFARDGESLLSAGILGMEAGRDNPRCSLIAAAFGARKAEAILGAIRARPHDTLIIDRDAADEMMRILELS